MLKTHKRDCSFVVGLALVLAIFGLAQTLAAQAIPTDAVASCPVPTATFNSWFQSGTPSLNGVVNPADSLHFPNIPNCTFYQWSEQMFLWLTSPAPTRYGGGSHIFASPTFFDISSPDANGNRTFVQHRPGLINILGVRAAKPGPDMLPVIFNKQGKMFEVAKPQLSKAGKPLVLGAAGKQIAASRIVVRNKRAVFLDNAGKPIPNARPLVAKRPITRAIHPVGVKKATLAQKFMVNGRPVFIDPSGNVIDTEGGQADGSVLEAQNHSLIYYAIMVNDVYAYFLTGAKDNAITPAPTQFPTTQADLTKITTFASAHNKTFPDPNALAVEVKTAWIDASQLPNANQYITTQATIPTYNTSNPNQWVPTGTKTATLALVSMHVVGSTSGHPEMIWATFEHFGNSPNAMYTYNSTSGLKTVAQSAAGAWLFSASNSSGPFNQPHMSLGANNSIVSVSPFSISPSDTMRMFPFGMPSGSASSNTEVISINHSVSSQMPAGDIRNNYYLVGATWTPFGATPTGTNGVGTNQLANSTLETYAQGTNCFSCHVGNMLGVSSGGLSHIYGVIKPLF